MTSKQWLDSLESRLTFIKNNIISINTYKPITFHTDLRQILKKYNVDESRKYKKETFGSHFNLNGITINCNELSVDDIVIGYYSAVYINSMILKNNTQIINVYKDQRDKFFQLLIPHINLDLDIFENRFQLFLIMNEIQTKIYSVFKGYGFILPSVQQLKLDLIEQYKFIRLHKRKYLPKIKDLLINDTLYIINHVHGGIEKLANPDKILIPPSMNFYRVIASDYGAGVCATIPNRNEYLQTIKEMLEIPSKNFIILVFYYSFCSTILIHNNNHTG